MSAAADALLAVFGYQRAGRVIRSVVVPIRTVSGLNVREHWRARARRVKAEREAVTLICPVMPMPLAVQLTRLSPGVLDDDAVPGALKGCRDAIAAKHGIDDADPRIEWFYAQERVGRGQHGVRIDFMEPQP